MTNQINARTWELEGFKLDLEVLPYKDKYGKFTVKYEFFDGDKLVFAGEDYYPSPMNPPLSDESAYGLLFFFTVQPDDTDGEYFESYTPEQIKWRDSERCRELSDLVFEFENPYDEDDE